MIRSAGLALVALLLAGCATHAAETRPASSPAPLTVGVAPVRTVRFASSSELAGTVVATRSVTLGAAIPGKIVEVRVQVGDRVSAGETVATIDDAGFRAALGEATGSAAAASANRRVAQAALAAAEAKAGLAETTAGRMSELYAQGAIPRQAQDEAEAQRAEAQAAVAQARAAVAAATGAAGQAGAAVVSARVPLRDAAVVAPFAGVVVARDVEPGAVVGAGSPVVVLQDERDLEVDVAVPEASAPNLAPGRSLLVRIDALGTSFAGTVRTMLPSSDPQLRSVRARIALPPSDGLVAGMFARVRIDGRGEPARAVPVAALASRAGQDGVFAIDGGRAAFVPVQAGTVQNGVVALRGLPAGVQSVAVRNVAGLSDGAAVAVGP